MADELKPKESSHVINSWQQPGKVGMNFATYLQNERRAAPRTPRGTSDETPGSAQDPDGEGVRAKAKRRTKRLQTEFFLRGRIWA